MALIACPDCGSQVSDLAAACPKCGRPRTAGTSTLPPPGSSQPAPVSEKGKYLGCGALLLIALALIVSVSIPNRERRPSSTASQVSTQTAPHAQVALPPHEVTEVHRAGAQSIWYFVVAPKTTSKADLRRIAEYYAAKHRDLLVFNLDILCDHKYASYATGIQSDISDKEYFSHVLLEWQAGRRANADNSVERKGLGSACGN